MKMKSDRRRVLLSRHLETGRAQTVAAPLGNLNQQFAFLVSRDRRSQFIKRRFADGKLSGPRHGHHNKTRTEVEQKGLSHRQRRR